MDNKKELEKLKEVKDRLEEIKYMADKIIKGHVGRVDKYALIAKMYDLAKNTINDVDDFLKGEND